MADPIAVEFDGLRAFLMQQPFVRDAVVNGDEVRIYPAVLPQAGKYPALTYQLVTDLPQHHMAGRSSLEFARVQVGVYDTEYKPARRLAARVVDAVSGFRGKMGSVDVYECTVEGPRHFVLSDLKLHELQLDVLLWFRAI